MRDRVGLRDRLGIAHGGAGLTLAEARRPAFVDRAGRCIALISVNCVGSEIAWATPDSAGCDYLAVSAADGGPSRPQAELVEADPSSRQAMVDRIAAARAVSDIVVVALHKGITHRPATLAAYERPVARAAIDAGADVVVGHHAHIARGIEFHRGRPIFHGLGNGVVVTRALSPAQDHPARAEWAERRKHLFGFEPDPAYSLAPFHPEAVNGLIGRCRFAANGDIEAGFVPMWVAPPGRPEIAEGDRAAAIAAYVDGIGVRAGLAPLDWQWRAGTEVLRPFPSAQAALRDETGHGRGCALAPPEPVVKR